jgi:hypothetical protein
LTDIADELCGWKLQRLTTTHQLLLDILLIASVKLVELHVLFELLMERKIHMQLLSSDFFGTILMIGFRERKALCMVDLFPIRE